MKTYIKYALMLMLLCYVAFSAGYIYKTEQSKREFVEKIHQREYELSIGK